LGEYRKTPEYCGPLYKDISVSGNNAEITFTHTSGGLKKHYKNAEIGEFEVRIDGGRWVPAKAEISKNKVIVTAEDAAVITGVRMGYRNSPRINVYNGAGYCASPFVWEDNEAVNRHGAAEKWSAVGDTHFKKCTAQGCSERFEEEEHTGKAPSNCQERAICEKCGYPFGEYGPHGETFLKNEKAPTENEEGYSGDVYCKDCLKQIKEGEVMPPISQQRKNNFTKTLMIGLAALVGVVAAAGTATVLFVKKSKAKKQEANKTAE
jgi:hypothetical protein